MMERRYTIHDMVATFNVSRTTLLYYEELGILRPQRAGAAGYRSYSSKDIFRLMCAIMLKNVGIQPKQLPELLDGDPLNDENFSEYIALSKERMKYYLAQRECLEMLDELRRKLGSIEVVDVEAYYIVWDKAETGYRDFPKSDNLDLLISHMPIGGLGSQSVEDFPPDGHYSAARWGRTVAVRFANLIPGFEGGPDTIGGCRCLRCIMFAKNLYDPTDTYFKLDSDMQPYLAAHGLKPAGRMFCPYSLPSGDGFYVPNCLPVVRADD